MNKWTLSIIVGAIIVTGSLIGLKPNELAQLKADIEVAQQQCFAEQGAYCQIRSETDTYKIVANVYDGPRGKGYLITVNKRVADGIEQTIYNTGGETERSKTTTKICTDFISSTSTDNLCAL
jgi:hypothetical protein